MKKFRAAVLTLIILALAAVMPAWGAMSNYDFVELCGKGSVQQIRTELLRGANPNTTIESLFNYHNNGLTALMNAAISNTPEVVSFLLKAGANVNARRSNVLEEDGYTAQNITKTPRLFPFC